MRHTNKAKTGSGVENQCAVGAHRSYAVRVYNPCLVDYDDANRRLRHR